MGPLPCSSSMIQWKVKVSRVLTHPEQLIPVGYWKAA